MKPLFISLLLISCLILSCDHAKENIPFTILQIDCDGTLTEISHNGIREYQEKNWRGHVSNGILFGNDFFAMGMRNNTILLTDFSQQNGDIIVYHNDLSLNTNYYPRLIGYVDEKQIIFSSILSKKNIPFKKQRSHYYLYKIDRNSSLVTRLAINNCANSNFSYLNGAIYYTSEDGSIYKYKNEKIQSLGIRGLNPTISPDGSKLAYTSFGLVKFSVKIFDFLSKKTTTAIKLGGINPIIRWSKNSTLIAVKSRSDIFSATLYVVDTRQGRIISKFTNNHACNWFFR